MSKRRPTLHLKSSPERDALDELPDKIEPDQEQTTVTGKAGPRKRPPRLMPYSMKEYPEHEGAVSLARAALLATRTDWERLCQQHPGKVLNGLMASPGFQTAAGKEIMRALIGFVRANQEDVSLSDSQGPLIPLTNPDKEHP
jgi:hypothetical protein